MGKGTNFDPHILEDAYNELARIPTIISSSNSLKHIQTVSEINSDVSAMDDKNGGWTYLSTQVSNVTGMVSQYVTALQNTAGGVHDAMRASIDTLKGADTSTTQTVNSVPVGNG